MVGPLVLCSNMLVQVSEVVAAVSTFTAVVKLLTAWLPVWGPGQLCGRLQVQGEEGGWGGTHTGGGLGGSSHTGGGLGGRGPAVELERGVVLALSG